jgi:hypothetical protein
MVLAPAPVGRRPAIYTGGEAAVHRWAVAAARALDDDARAVVDAAALREAAAGPTRALDRLWLLDAGRRGAGLELRALEPADALAALIASHFLGAADPASWRRHLAATQAVAAGVPAVELSVPDGLDLLDRALAGYTTSSAS